MPILGAVFVLAKARADRPETAGGEKHQRESFVTIKGKAYIAGITSIQPGTHPIIHRTLHAEVAKGAID